jgi:hypothetical protein
MRKEKHIYININWLRLESSRVRQRGERIGRRFQVKKMMMRVDGFAEPCWWKSSKLNLRNKNRKLSNIILFFLVKKIDDRSFFSFLFIIFSSTLVDSFHIDMVSFQSVLYSSILFFFFDCERKILTIQFKINPFL